MKRLLIFLCATLFLVTSADAKKKDKPEDMYRYELESYDGQVTADSKSCVVRVWSYGKKEALTRNECMKNAVHGVLFKGYSAASQRTTGKSALVPEGYQAHQAYFDEFFSSGKYLQFVEITNKGIPEPGSVIKISKKEYKIGMVVLISYSALRTQLEKDGIIKKLDFLF